MPTAKFDLVDGKYLVQVYLFDNQIKNVQVDQGASIFDLLEAVGEKLLLLNPGVVLPHCTIFQLKDDGLTLLPMKGDQKLTTVLANWNAEYSTRSNATFKLIFGIKLFLTSLRDLSALDVHLLRLVYIQNVHFVITGRYPVAIDEVATLAALEMQEKYGSFNPESHKFGFLSKSLIDYVPTPVFKSKKLLEWENLILKCYADLSPEARESPMQLYNAILYAKPYYGNSFFLVAPKMKTFVKVMPNIDQEVIVGISSFGVRVFGKNQVDKAPLLEFPITKLFKWGFKPDMRFYIQAYDENGKEPKDKSTVLKFMTNLGHSMSDLLSEYAEALMSEVKRNGDVDRIKIAANQQKRMMMSQNTK